MLKDSVSRMHASITIYSDGGARGNPGPAAIGVLLCDAEGNRITEFQEVIGHATNNVAEYRAVLKGLDLAKAVGAKNIHYYVDSQLVAYQVTGKYRIKAPHIQELFLQVREKLKHFSKAEFTQVPRTHEKIRYVDRLVNLALDHAGH